MKSFVYLLFLLTLSDTTRGAGSLLSRSLLKSLQPPQRKLLNEKHQGFLKSVVGQFFLYMGTNLGVQKGEKPIEQLTYEEKEADLKGGLLKFVNVVEGVNFNDKECSFKFGSKKEELTVPSEECKAEGISIADLGDKSPVVYLEEKVKEAEFGENKVVFLLGKGEGDDMEILMAIEVQAFKALKKDGAAPQQTEVEVEKPVEQVVENNEIVDQQPIEDNERKLKEAEEEGELVIRIMNSVAESRLKVQYAEQTVPSTNKFLNNVVTAFMLKNDQLVFSLEDLKTDLAKMLIFNFTNDNVEEFSADNYEITGDKDVSTLIQNDNLNDPKSIDRLKMDGIKFHLHYMSLKAEGGDDKNYFGHYHKTTKDRLGKHAEAAELENAEEQLMFLLTPNFMFIPPISIILSRSGTAVKVIFHSAYFESTEYFSFAARPFITKIVEKRVKKMAAKILRPIAILEHQSQDEEFTADKANLSSAYIFLNTLNKMLDAFLGDNSPIELNDAEVSEATQTLVQIADSIEDCAMDEAGERILCVAVNAKDLSEEHINMFEIHHKIFQPEPMTFMKRYPTNSLYDMGLFAKSYARYLVDVVESVTSVGDMVDSPSLYKHSFPPFEPPFSGIKTTYASNDVFFLDESKAEPISEPATLEMEMIPEGEENKVKTVGYKYVVSGETKSRFNEYLTGGGGGGER